MAPSPVSTQDCIDMLGRLVAYDTTSALSNLALIEDVREQLAALGVEVRLTHNTVGDKANLWATIGPADRGARGFDARVVLVFLLANNICANCSGNLFSNNNICANCSGNLFSNEP